MHFVNKITPPPLHRERGRKEGKKGARRGWGGRKKILGKREALLPCTVLLR